MSPGQQSQALDKELLRLHKGDSWESLGQQADQTSQSQRKSATEYSLEGLVLKLKLQYFGHLMQRINSLEKTLLLGKIEGKRRRRWPKMRWLDEVTDSMNMSLSKLREIVKDREAWRAIVHRVTKSWTQLSNWTTTTTKTHGPRQVVSISSSVKQETSELIFKVPRELFLFYEGTYQSNSSMQWAFTVRWSSLPALHTMDSCLWIVDRNAPPFLSKLAKVVAKNYNCHPIYGNPNKENSSQWIKGASGVVI